MTCNANARTMELLKACKDLIESHEYTQEQIVFYDDAECDGGCLLEDITNHLIEVGEIEG